MKTLGQIYGTEGTFREKNYRYSGWDDRLDFIVKCPECDQGMSFSDILDVKEWIDCKKDYEYGYFRKNYSKHWACPFCNKFIDSVRPIILRD